MGVDCPFQFTPIGGLVSCFSHPNLPLCHFQVTKSVVSTVDNIIDSYVGDTSPDNEETLVPQAPNQIQRALEQQISTLQTNPGNTTITARNVAIMAVKVKKESVVNRKLIFEAIPERHNSTSDTRVKTGEPPKKEAEAAISFQLPSDVLSDVDGMYMFTTTI